MNFIDSSLFGLASIFSFLLWILGGACLIQLLRFLTKGIKVLDIYLEKK
jgi:hypothetical protein